MRKRSRSFGSSMGRQRKPAGSRKRRLAIQSLESRHLLAGEGIGFDVSRSFTTTGLVGSLSSTVTWGDNTQSAGSVSGTVDNSGPLSIKFEYMGSFFNDTSRRTLLQNAAASVIERFSDDLQAITPTSFLNWTAVTNNPVTGAQLRIPNLAVAANQLVIYVGARNFSGNKVGEAFPGYAETSFPGLYTPSELQQINAWQETLQYRGEAGAELANPTDIGPWGGYISFDADTNWHFGATTDGLDSDEVDFSTVAVHEMMHALGFGVNYVGSVNSSFETVTSGLNFTGAKAKALYGGNVPLKNSDHFADEVENNGQQSVITSQVDKGTRKVITPLDLAALDDIGWSIRSAPSATVTASHVYADNPDTGTTYPVEVVLRGSLFGEVTQSLTNTVTNTPPTLSLPPNQSVQVGQSIAITNLGEISDPGFTSTAAGSTESFTYSINWGDGDTDTGDATIDRNGSATATTQASFNGTHTYDTVGTYTVGVAVTDDDGGSKSSSFTITVTPPPVLSLTVSNSNLEENAGANAATLTVIRSGPALASNQTIQLQSSDTTEATVAASVVIPAGSLSITTPINIVDDTLLDGTQLVTFTASAAGTESGETSLNVQDAESLTASFVGGNVTEGDTTSVVLRITRSNTDATEPITVNIGGGNSQQLTLDNSVEIAAGQRSLSVPLTPVQDEQPELTKSLSFTITATGYSSATASVDVLDDEPPLFQNQDDRFDTNGEGGLTPDDILTVINQLANEGSGVILDPEVRAPDGKFYDVDGNYTLTPNDILEVINELAERAQPGGESEASGEQIVPASVPPTSVFLVSFNEIEDEDETRLRSLLESPSLL